MIELAVYNTLGKQIDSINVNESVLGGRVRYALLKQAIVMYHANKRVGTAATKSRSLVEGSTKKLFRQKGTGFARVGTRRTGKRVGGGVTFAKVARDFRQRMPRRQRQLARDSAVLAKLMANNVIVVDELKFENPRTRDFAGVLKNLKIERSCLVTTGSFDENVYKSARNVENVSVLTVGELNAADVCRHHKVLFTKDAFVSFVNRDGAQDN